MSEQDAAPRAKSPRRTGNVRPDDWKTEAAKGARAVALKLIGTGNAGLLALILIIAALAFKLDPKDLSSILTLLVTSQLFSIMGWLAFVLTLYFANRVFRGMGRSRIEEINLLTQEHNAELNRLQEQHREEIGRLVTTGAVALPTQPVLPSATNSSVEKRP